MYCSFFTLILLTAAMFEDSMMKPMCMAFLTLILTKSVGTQFNWHSEDQCRRTHSIWGFVFIPQLKSKYCLLILSKLSRKSALCPVRSPWLRIPQVRTIGHCVIGQERDLLWPDWLNWWVLVCFSVRNTNFPHTLKPWNSRARVGYSGKSYMDALVKFQKGVVRIMSVVQAMTHTDPLFTNLKLLKCDEIKKFLVGRLTCRIYIDDITLLFFSNDLLWNSFLN